YYAGMALSRLERWKEAREAFSRGARKGPEDARFLTERAGAEYKLNDFSGAKTDLLRALRLDPGDDYVPQFLGTVYLLEGNLEAAVKHGNVLGKPRLASAEMSPSPKAITNLLERAIAFSPRGTLGRESFLKTNAQLENLQVFPRWRLELTPNADSVSGEEDRATVRLIERNGWGTSLLDGMVSLLRGAPYETVYPSYYNLHGEAVNFDGIARWDSQKRRIAVSVSFPAFDQPAKRIRFFFDARNENWNLSQSFFGSMPAISDLNMK